MSKLADCADGMLCHDMLYHINLECAEHGDACGDRIVRRMCDGTIGIIVHDGGGSVIEIRFCPWCGSRLPSAFGCGNAPAYVDRSANIDIRTPEEHEPR